MQHTRLPDVLSMYVTTFPAVFGRCVQLHAAVHSPLMSHAYCASPATQGRASPARGRQMMSHDLENWQQVRTYIGPGVCQVTLPISLRFVRKVSCANLRALPGSHGGAM